MVRAQGVTGAGVGAAAQLQAGHGRARGACLIEGVVAQAKAIALHQLGVALLPVGVVHLLALQAHTSSSSAGVVRLPPHASRCVHAHRHLGHHRLSVQPADPAPQVRALLISDAATISRRPLVLGLPSPAGSSTLQMAISRRRLMPCRSQEAAAGGAMGARGAARDQQDKIRMLGEVLPDRVLRVLPAPQAQHTVQGRAGKQLGAGGLRRERRRT